MSRELQRRLRRGQFGRRSPVWRHKGESARHGLKHDVPEGLRDGRKDKHVGARVKLRERAPTELPDERGPRRSNGAAPRLSGTVTGERERNFSGARVTRHHLTHALKRHINALLRCNAPNIHHEHGVVVRAERGPQFA